jgi:hypothetical protein
LLLVRLIAGWSDQLDNTRAALGAIASGRCRVSHDLQQSVEMLPIAATLINVNRHRVSGDPHRLQ